METLTMTAPATTADPQAGAPAATTTPRAPSAATPQDVMLTPEQLQTLREGIRLAMARRLESGLVPYQGQWLPRAEAEARLRAERRKAWLQLIQLILLSGLGMACSLVLFALLKALL